MVHHFGFVSWISSGSTEPDRLPGSHEEAFKQVFCLCAIRGGIVAVPFLFKLKRLASLKPLLNLERKTQPASSLFFLPRSGDVDQLAPVRQVRWNTVSRCCICCRGSLISNQSFKIAKKCLKSNSGRNSFPPVNFYLKMLNPSQAEICIFTKFSVYPGAPGVPHLNPMASTWSL